MNSLEASSRSLSLQKQQLNRPNRSTQPRKLRNRHWLPPQLPMMKLSMTENQRTKPVQRGVSSGRGGLTRRGGFARSCTLVLQRGWQPLRFLTSSPNFGIGCTKSWHAPFDSRVTVEWYASLSISAIRG
jgi:hypothetical protein